jgi:hypothetical protein
LYDSLIISSKPRCLHDKDSWKYFKRRCAIPTRLHSPNIKNPLDSSMLVERKITSSSAAASTFTRRRDSRAPSPSPYRHAACNALSTTVDSTANATECCVMLGMNIIANYHIINFGGGFHLRSSKRLAGSLTIALSTSSLQRAFRQGRAHCPRH